jgi:hypothetical protein
MNFGRVTTNVYSQIKVLAVSFTVLTLFACNQNSSDTGAGGAKSANGFNLLLSQTFTHPRCANCHGFDEGNTVASRHSSLGRSSDCQSCHDVPTWRAPFRSFSFSKLSSIQICQGAKNRSSSDISVLKQHLIEDPLILWAVNSAFTQGIQFDRAPPGSASAWIAIVNTWLNNGAICD